MGKKVKEDLTPQQVEERRLQRYNERVDRFHRIAPRRVNSAVKMLDAVGRLGNPQTYFMSYDQRCKIVQHLQDAMKAMIDALSNHVSKREEFTL